MSHAASSNDRSWRSTGSITSALSSGSIASVLSAGSIASALSAGSIGSFASAGSIASFASRGSLLSGLSKNSVLSWRSENAFLGRPFGDAAPAARMLLGRGGRALTIAGTIGAVALTAHTVYNLRKLRTPSRDPATQTEPISLLIPARDEAPRIENCVRALMSQGDLSDVEILVLDDRSSDGTGDVVRALTHNDPRVRVIDGVEPPHGWLGKPWACQQLAQAASGNTLVFVDADVIVEPHGIASTVELMRNSGLDLVCPYPRQLAVTPAERLVQPLLQWSWLTTLPLVLAERSPRESLVAANGQLLAVDAAVYRLAGSHEAVRHEVLDDVALLRAVKGVGGKGNVVDGTDVATCRMYESWTDLQDGYTKSLWSAFGSPVGAAGAVGLLGLFYIVPPLAALRGSRIGAIGALAGFTGRVLVARRTGSRAWPDSLAHPVSVGLFGYLTALSWRRRKAGRLRWKGRAI